MSQGRTGRLRFIMLLLLLLSPGIPCMWNSAVQAEVPVPPWRGLVSDEGSLLSDSERMQLLARLTAFEKRKGVQIAVLIVRTTGDEPIEDFSQRTFDRWKVGRKGIDDGVLLVIAHADRHARIHTGYGAEGALPDARAKQILERAAIPAFRQNHWAEGIESSVDGIIAALDHEPFPDPGARGSETPGFSDHAGWFVAAGLAMIAALILPFRNRFWGLIALPLNLAVWIPVLLFLSDILAGPQWLQNIVIVICAVAGLVSIGHLLMTIHTGSSVTSSGGSSPSSTGSSVSSSGSSDSSGSGGGGSSGGGGASSSW